MTSAAIQCRGLRKSFGRQEVLAGVDLEIPAGSVAVVLGPSGTGKSVLARHLTGLLRPDAGEVLVHGVALAGLSRSELMVLRRDFGILFQDGALFGSMTVFDNVAFPLRQHTDLREEEIAAIVGSSLRDVGLSGTERLMPSELSGGMRKRAGLARALVLEPRVVLFDEPDSGLDPVRTALLCELIAAVHEDRGGTYVVITHDIATARRIGDFVAMLWQGRIVQAGPAEEMFASDDPFVRQFLAGQATGPLGMG